MTDRGWVRDVALVGAAMTIGWWAHGGTRAEAATPDVFYQFSAITPASSLTLYNAEERAIYVYQGATSGSSHVNCSYKFVLSRPGAPVERENCAIGSLTR